MKQTGKLISLLLLLSFVLSGCFGQSSKHVRGKVVLGDTDLGLWSTLSLGGHSLTTNDDGTFSVDLPAGTYNFQVSNLLGTFSGTVELQNSGTARLEVPASVIPDWSPMGFNTFLAHSDSSRKTSRWPRYKTLNVWIDESNPEVTAEAMSVAVQSFEDWEEALDGLITFQFVPHSSNAHITLRWDPNDPNLSSTASGVCAYQWSGNYEMQKGEIIVSSPKERRPYLYQHEIGHCIGIGHAYDIELAKGTHNYVMGFGILLSDHDIAWMKLLYSIPVGTPRLPTDSNAVTPRYVLPDHLDDIVYPSNFR